MITNGCTLLPEIKTRSLIYHICPLRTNDLWQRNLDQLLARIHIFNGYRIFAIAKGEADRFHEPEEVMNYIGSIRCRYMMFNNCPNMRETESFRPLLDAVHTLDPTQAIFYAHTKGNSTFDDVQGAIYWRNAMYHVLLDNWETCCEHLRKYQAVGTTKICWPKGIRSPYPSRLQHSNWMFAGTFYWFRAREVFSNPKWKIVPRDRYGAEAWIGGLVDCSKAKSMMQPWPETKYPTPSPYDPELYMKMGMAIGDVELKHPSYCI